MIFDGDDQAFPKFPSFQNCKFPKQQVCNIFTIYLKEGSEEIDFLHADKHQNFLQVDF